MRKYLKKIAYVFFFFIRRIDRAYKGYLLNQVYRSLKYFGPGSSMDYPLRILNPKYISIGANFSSLWNLRLEVWDSYFDQSFSPELKIGDNVNVNSDVHIGCINKVVIGNNVLIASRVYITDHSHGDTSASIVLTPPQRRFLMSKGPVIIEDNVWIGEGVCILSNVTVGKNSVIGSNAVVTKSIPPNTVVAGIPARVIKTIEL